MITSLSLSELADYTSDQLNHFFPDKEIIKLAEYKSCVQLALDRMDYCYQKVSLKHYFDGTHTLFSHLYSDQYVMYVWFLANTIWQETQNKNLCNKLYYLNKSLHGLDCMFDTKLPDIFLIFHGVGTMLGKATYSDFFVVLQGCTVGMNRGKYPVMGKGVALTAHSSLIGNCNVGKLVTVSSYTNIIDEKILDGMVVYKTDKGEIQQKSTVNSYAQTFFNIPI